MTTGVAPLYHRTHILVGDPGIARLRAARVLVVGLGGVGSFAAEALARAGIGDLSLLDHDRVSASNLNRQLVALGSTLGRSKAEVMAERIRDINPECRITLIQRFIGPGDVPGLLGTGFHLVLDAIDSLSSKVELIASAVWQGVPILSSMGAGGRLDPTRLQVADLMDTRVCPLARAVRARLRRRGIGRGVTAVWSDEPPRPPLPAEDLGRDRTRVINGTLSFLPGLFGLTLAGLAVNRLIGPPASGLITGDRPDRGGPWGADDGP